MSVTSSRILDLLADAARRVRSGQENGAELVWWLDMTEAERVAFDLFLVRMGDPLGYQAGPGWLRFWERVRRMTAPFMSETP